MGVAVAVGSALALVREAPSASMHAFMHGAMGFSLCVFSLLKLFDPKKFADGFEMYDPIAQRSRAYARGYPFLELALGLGFFAHAFEVALYVATMVVFALGSVGVVAALGRGLDIDCPCMGTVLEVPLSTVTLAEDLAMAAMAGILLLGASG